jgi:hypothetical protein
MKVRHPIRPHFQKDIPSMSHKLAPRTTRELFPASESRYYIAFIARSGLPGHAFVQWLKVDAQRRMTSSEAFGFYPKYPLDILHPSTLKVLFGNVPSVLNNEYSQKKHLSGDILLRLEVTAGEFRQTLSIKDEWKRRADAGQPYDLGGLDCIDFIDRIARALRSSRPEIKIQAYDNDNLKDKIYNTLRGPYSYVKHLYELNHGRNANLDISFP